MIYNPFSLEGKTILITGASSGIGKKTALECSRMGARLILTGRNLERLTETFDSLAGEGHVFFGANLDNLDERNRLIDSVPVINGLVNCAGIVKTLPLNFINQENLTAIFNTNFFSPVLLTLALIKRKKIAEGGSIVIISSISGIECAIPGNAVYSASKGALTSMSKVMALELASKKIRVNSILSGMVNTKMAENLVFSEEEIVADMKKYPLGYGESEDVAFGTIYLLSDASKWITGTDLKMDGGYTLH